MEESILAELSDDELDSLHTNVGVAFKDLNSYDLGSQYIQIIVSLKKVDPKDLLIM